MEHARLFDEDESLTFSLLGVQCRLKQSLFSTDKHARMEASDADHDNVLSWDEFSAHLKAAAEERDKKHGAHLFPPPELLAALALSSSSSSPLVASAMSTVAANKQAAAVLALSLIHI